MMHPDEQFMKRCINLALISGKKVGSNPNVGALLVANDRIIGEGFHQQFGKEHAEIVALNDVSVPHRRLIPDSTLYVTLEPCSHHGKTPPCVQRIVDEGIKKVVIGCEDPNPLVSGKGIQFLKDRGVSVYMSGLKYECLHLIRRFRANLQQRPYIILKWAQSADNFLSKQNEQTWLSNKYSVALVHKWRSECDGILIGKNTAIIDQPKLDTRHYGGESPLSIVLDSNLEATSFYKNRNHGNKLLIFNKIRDVSVLNFKYIQVPDTKDLALILSMLFKYGVNTLIVEGGGKILQSFVQSGQWDEARVIKTAHMLGEGILAPQVIGSLNRKIQLLDDEIYYIDREVM
jgi:diaminohydroxyphosphoribosylaminopyrimidine deaminase/5-amino-6-(5-phosphoribosylamino)uracil reductase